MNKFGLYMDHLGVGGQPADFAPDLSLLNGGDLVQVVGGSAVVDVGTSIGGHEIVDDLQALGMTDVSDASLMASGWLPLDKVDDLALLPDVTAVRAALRPLTLSGSAYSLGDIAQRSDDARAQSGADGTGVTVAVISDSYDTAPGASTRASDDVGSGDLPVDVAVLNDNYPLFLGPTDEGRAMLQIVHDVAPGADLAFHTAGTSIVTFANAFRNISSQVPGPKIVVDDILFLHEPMFQLGTVGNGAAHLVNVPVFSAAGNAARQSYESSFQPGATFLIDVGPGGPVAEVSHEFAPGDSFQRITIPTNQRFRVSFQWDDPYLMQAQGPTNAPGPESDLNIYLVSAATGRIVAWSNFVTGEQTDPIEAFSFTNFAAFGLGTQFDILITNRSGRNPDVIKYVHFDSSVTINEHATLSPTLFGHANTPFTIAVGASAYFQTPEFGVNPPILEPFTAVAGVPHLFDFFGLRNEAPLFWDKPDLIAPDGGNTTFLGVDIVLDADTQPNFFGTSAAAPHAAAVAALMLENSPTLKSFDVFNAFIETAIDFRAPGHDFESGHGLLDAAAALKASIMPPMPELSISSDTGFSNNDHITRDSTPEFIGFAEPGWIVRLYSHSRSSGVVTLETTTTAQAGSGFYSATSLNKADGDYGFSVTVAENALAPESHHSIQENITIDTVAPHVTQVTARSGAASFPVPAQVNSDVQVRPIPLAGGVDRIEVEFDEDVFVPSDPGEGVRLSGVFNGTTTEYPVTVSPGFGASTTMTANIVGGPITKEQLWLQLYSGEFDVADAAGNALDGAWINPTGYGDNFGNDAYPSGDGYGGDFEFKMVVVEDGTLVGDTHDDGKIDITDLNDVRNNFGATGPADGTLVGDAFPYDGVVDITDLNAVRNHFGEDVTVWPSESPPLPGGGAMAMAGPGAAATGEARLRQVLADLYFDRIARRTTDSAVDDLFGWKELGDARWWNDLLGRGWQRRL